MASVTTLQNTWSILTEMDTRGLRESIHAPFSMFILGQRQQDRQWLADALRTDPFTHDLTLLSPQVSLRPLPTDLRGVQQVARAKLVFIVIDASADDARAEEQTLAALLAQNPHLPVMVVQLRANSSQERYIPLLATWQGAREVVLDTLLPQPFGREFISALTALLPDAEIPLGYHLPALRPALARRLIHQTSMSNATYAATTGLAELIPAMLIPGNVADMMVLTKNQGLMAYKIALLMGYDIGLQEMLGELAGVLGSGFLWRETARRLVGFVPVWGLAPKIAVAYAGTHLVGDAALYWYAWHEKMSVEQMHELYARAMTEGREKAANILSKLKRDKRRKQIKKPRKRLTLPKPQLTRKR